MRKKKRNEKSRKSQKGKKEGQSLCKCPKMVFNLYYVRLPQGSCEYKPVTCRAENVCEKEND